MLIETIRIQNGEPLHLSYHNSRMNSSRRELYHCEDNLDLHDWLGTRADYTSSMIKCRVIYSERIEEIEYLPYEQKRTRSLQVVFADGIEYSHKYLDRSVLNELKAGVLADDIVIVKHGFITDSAAGNVVFFDGCRWITPAQPLLQGTTRARLLETGKITCEELCERDLVYFKKVAVINAMNDLSKINSMPISRLRT